ncbi:hypothetical protein M422DRAFT_24144 [Sphaerobolus stellatus SS14]|nr:hypothetical protein M422DRAFT_24144 [Sphaerobolus stellatus SS14]
MICFLKLCFTTYSSLLLLFMLLLQPTASVPNVRAYFCKRKDRHKTSHCFLKDGDKICEGKRLELC